MVGDQTLGSDVLPILSPALTSSGHTFAVTGVLTLEDTLTIDGARVEADELNIDQFGSINGQSGSLLAETLLLSNGATLELSTTDLINTAGFDFEAGTFEVAGIVRGSGTVNINTGVMVQSNGEVRIAIGERVYFAGSGAAHTNSGRIEIIGNSDNVAELEFDGQITNANDGLINGGVVNVSFGTSDISGDINNTGNIGLASGAQLTLFDDLIQNGSFSIGSGSVAVVFGDFSGSGGTTGTGKLEILGTFSPGNSPDVVMFGGDLDLSPSVSTLIELGGVALGEFDRTEVAGMLTLGGDLLVELYDGHTLELGQHYQIFTAGVLSGAFHNLADDALVANLSGVDLFIDYDHGLGSVSLYPLDAAGFPPRIPAPTSAALFGLTLLLMSGRRS